jgi:RHS repeat-associated protein
MLRLWNRTCAAVRSSLPNAIRASAIFFCLMAAPWSLRAQTDPMSVDARPFAPLQGATIDSVSASNGGLQVHIPLWSLKQRGNLSLSLSLRYTSSGYNKDHECIIPNKPCTDTYIFLGRGVVVAASTDVAVTAIPAIVQNNGGDPLNPTYFAQGYYWQVTTPDGGTHKLASIGSHNFRSEDGSGWLFNESTYTLTSQDGVHYVYYGTPAPNQGTLIYPTVGRLLYVEDTNGNQINLTYSSYVSGGVTFYLQTGWIDTLGRTIPYSGGSATTDYSGCTGNGAITSATVFTPPGSNSSIKFCSAMTQLNTDFFHGTALSQPGPNQTEFENHNSVELLQSVVLLDGSSWTFQYTPIDGSQYNYGELSLITLPTGGTIGYTWAEGYQICTNTASQSQFNSVVQSRIANANDAIGAQTWTYGGSYQGSAPPAAPVTVASTDPLGNRTVHTLTGLSGTCSLFETQTDYFDNQNNKLRTDTTTYLSQPDINRINTNYTRESQTAMGVFPQVRTTTLWVNGTAGDTKSTTYTYDGGFSATNFDGSASAVIPYGQVTTQVDTDYGAGSPGPSLRSIATTYFSAVNGSALSNNLLEQPSSVTVADGPTGLQQNTTYGYDEYGLAAGNANPGANTGWNPSPISGLVRGNQTSITRSWDTNGTTLRTSKTYTNTGMVASITEPPNPSVTPAAGSTYQYSGVYDGAFATTITNALGQQTLLGYDSSTGLLTEVIDPNGVPTIYGYDAADRLHTVTRPAGSHNLASSVTYTYPSANTSVRAEALSSSNGMDTLSTTFDGLGRESRTDHADPEGDVYVDMTYDALGRESSKSTPYRSQGDTSFYGLTKYFYDAIGRVISTQNPDGTLSSNQYAGVTTLSTSESNGSVTPQKLTQVDGLGRVTKVCEVTSTTPPVGTDTPVNCGMEIAGTGFVTSYVQTIRGLRQVTQGSQTRSFAYDSLGRLTDSVNPESGHLHYVYDPDGNVLSKTLPLANAAPGSGITSTITYSYDALHRLLNKAYSRSDGTAVATPIATFAYDQGSVDGKTLENPIGRLTSEFTTLGGSVQTKSLYSYDSAGSVESHYQCVLASCTGSYQDVEYDYDGAENLTSQTTPQNSFSFSFNAASHLTSVTPSWIADANHPATVLTSAQYAPNEGWSVAHMGNLTNESYTYTPRWLQSLQVNGYNPNSLPHGVAAIRIDGTEQSAQSTTQPAQPATALVTVTGAERSFKTTGPPGCGGTASATLSPSPNLFPPCITTTTYDVGTLTVTVNGHATSYAWNGNTLTSTSVASAIASAINADTAAPESAGASGSTIILTAKATGPSSDYPLSVSVSHTATSNFPSPSFGLSSGSALSGGANAVTSTLYDTGIMTLTVGGVSQSVSYGQGSTWQSVSQALINAANANPNFLANVAYIDGQTMSVTARLGGSIGNYPMVFTTSYDSGHFSHGSYSPVWSATALSGGQDQTGNEVAIYSYSLGHAPNGQITSANDSVNGNWGYTYDEFNRLHTASQTSNSTILSSLSWDYDRYGNRWHQNNTGGTGLTHQLTYGISNQATTNLSYDTAGNVVSDTNNTFTYDAENRIAQVSGGISYIYDAEGRRVGKSDGTIYVVGLDGRVIDELNGAAWKRTEIYAGGRHLATDTPQGAFFTHSDWIGTERARTNPLGEMCWYATSEPFGDNAQTGTPSGTAGCSPSPNFLTGKQRDTETGLDDFGARYLSSQWGGWMSPDWSESPAPIPYATLLNPQSLNLYSYVGNDPISGQDPDGHFTISIGGFFDNGGGWMQYEAYQDFIRPEAPASKPQPQYDSACNCFRVNAQQPGIFRRLGDWLHNSATAAAIGFVRFVRLGGPAHRAAVDRISNLLEQDGYTVTKEKYFKTPNGAKSGRFVDVYGKRTTENGVQEKMFQVGRTNSDGTPVSREVQAMDDIQAAPANTSGLRPEFVDYNSPLATGDFAPVSPMSDMPMSVPEDIPIDPIP